jgi:uncharacterized membrane-anchored protein YitT (DUF2179 family)
MKELLHSIKLKNIIVLTLAGMINAFGVTIFLAPVRLYDSGISGTAMLISQITPDYLSLSLFLLLFNLPLFLYGLKKQGGVFTIYSLYAVGIYALTAWLITDILPIEVSVSSPFAENDLLLCALFGGLISGVGSGLVIRMGGAIDGVEVMAVIFAKRLGITVGTFVMIYNVLLYIICGIIMQSWILPLYSVITYAVALKTVDFIVEGLDRSKAAMIVTSCPDAVCKAISETFHCGMTRIQASGGYSGREKTVIYFVLNRFQITKLRNLVHEQDPGAYITISDVADVFLTSQNRSNA